MYINSGLILQGYLATYEVTKEPSSTNDMEKLDSASWLP